MVTPADPRPLLRFGRFEFDPAAGELRTNGEKSYLQEQPFRVLSMLVERPGQLITREELKKRLWPSDTFVDFDHSLNRAVNRLRDALEDSAEQPRYIETLPRRGYRFIAPIERDAESSQLSASRHIQKKRWGILVMAGAFTIALATGAFFHFHRAPALTETDTIVLLDFANSTGDTVFDDTLKQALSIQLSQSPFLNILSDQRMNETLQMMGHPADERVGEKAALEICQRTQSAAVLAGSIARLGSQYVISLKAVNCQTGAPLAQEQVQAASKEDVLKALGGACTKLREKLGESVNSIAKFNVPIFEATTPSLEALKSVGLGKKTEGEKGSAEAIPFFQRAIELDPNFATAYAFLAGSYSNLGENKLASENITRAYQLRDRGSEPEKLEFTFFYHILVTGDLERANQALTLDAQVYPRRPFSHLCLGIIYSQMGFYEKSLAEALETVRLTPDAGGIEYGNLVGCYMSLNRFSEAKAVYQQMQSRKIDGPSLHGYLYARAFLERDTAEMNRQVSWSQDKPIKDSYLGMQSDTEAFFGHLQKARELSARAVDGSRHNGQKEAAAEWRMDSALREVEFGNAGCGRQETNSALLLASTRDTQILAALALARAGDPARARKMADELAREFPMNTMLNGYWLPTIRAAIEIELKNPARAVELLHAASTYELGAPGPMGATIYPVYVRGQAELLLHHGSEAATEFQKFLDHPSIVLNFPFGALARLGIARAYALQNETSKARAAYQDFLALWKDADSDIPILKEAKAEYAKLQ
jgi:eukaryotic-like serine/threonine-protein kinase